MILIIPLENNGGTWKAFKWKDYGSECTFKKWGQKKTIGNLEVILEYSLSSHSLSFRYEDLSTIQSTYP